MIYYQTEYGPIIAKPKTTDDIPQRPLARMGVKLHLLGYLAWDYADTCVNIAASMGLSQTKRLSRAVRALKREYDRFRNHPMRDESLALEADLALKFEEVCEQHLAKLNYGIASDKETAGLNEDYTMLVKAVQMAMTILDTMKLYAAQCDAWIRSYGVECHSILADHFTSLAILIPQFAGDCYNPDATARKLTAGILLNEINKIETFDEFGKI